MNKCGCSTTIRVLGDGCEVCNPELAAELAEEAKNEAAESLTKCDGNHALVTPCSDPECWHKDTPSIRSEVRAALLFALWHHQGGSSLIGQPIRKILCIGEYAHMTEKQYTMAKSVSFIKPEALDPSVETIEQQGARMAEIIRKLGEDRDDLAFELEQMQDKFTTLENQILQVGASENIEHEHAIECMERNPPEQIEVVLTRGSDVPLPSISAVLMAETAYRRGFYQGASSAIDEVKDGVSILKIYSWIEEDLFNWRYSRHGGAFVFPPDFVPTKLPKLVSKSRRSKVRITGQRF